MSIIYLFIYSISDVTLCNETGDVRLTHFGMDTKGRLEVCYDGYWGSVCRDYYSDDTIAAVVCRKLGYFAAGQWIATCRRPHLFFCHIHTFVFPGRMFSVYEGPPYIPIVLDDLSCTGKETSLLSCCHIRGLHNCYATIGIECAGMYM